MFPEEKPSNMPRPLSNPLTAEDLEYVEQLRKTPGCMGVTIINVDGELYPLYHVYVPLQMVRAVDPKSFSPKLGFKTRYGLTANPFQ